MISPSFCCAMRFVTRSNTRSILFMNSEYGLDFNLIRVLFSCLNFNCFQYEAPYEKNVFFFAYAKTKTQISLAVTAKLISVFVSATQIVQSLYYLNPKFQSSSHLLWLYSLVCVGPGRKPQRPVFSERGSYVFSNDKAIHKIKLTLVC